MATSSPRAETSRAVWAILIGSWFISYFAVRVLLKENGAFGWALDPATPALARALIALIPVVPAGLAMIAFVRDVRQGDELERRIHLEALAFAFPLVVLLLMILGMLEHAVRLNPNDWSFRHIYQIVFFVWIFSYVKARSRYGVT